MAQNLTNLTKKNTFTTETQLQSNGERELSSSGAVVGQRPDEGVQPAAEQLAVQAP